MLAAVVFALGTHSLIAVLVAMAMLGFGVGGVFATMPSLVLTGVPHTETASVLTINQIVRSIAFSVGSALAGLLLTTATSAGALLPTRQGYITAALWALLPLGLSAVAILAGTSRAPLRTHRASAQDSRAPAANNLPASNG